MGKDNLCIFQLFDKRLLSFLTSVTLRAIYKRIEDGISSERWPVNSLTKLCTSLQSCNVRWTGCIVSQLVCDAGIIDK